MQIKIICRGAAANFSKCHNRVSFKSLCFVLFILILQFKVFSQSNDEVCKGSFRQVVFGESIGTTGLNVVDIDNDGIDEMILSGGDETFEDGRFWYVLKFSGYPEMFKQTWVSPYYSDRIMVISVLDIDNNGVYEVVLGLQSGRAEVYSTQDMSLQSSFMVDHTDNGYYNEGVVAILKADADNDGTEELVLLSKDSTSVYSGNPPVLEKVIKGGGYDLVCGNVDNEPSLELCYSNGSVVRLKNGVVNQLWDFNESPYFGGGRLGLADQDGDGNEEIFTCAYDSIHVLDVESKQEKFSFFAEVDQLSFLMKDINSDGQKELLYGEANWGSVYCHSTTDGSVIWSKLYGHGGLNCLNIGNVDNEPETEIIWATDHYTTGEDYLYTFDLNSRIQEWKSESVNGPFEKVQIFDVDKDGIEELVTVSAATQNFYDESRIFFWDPYTQELEWKSPDTLLYFTTHLYDFTIDDIDNDGVSEIIFPTAKSYTASIYILDPITHQIERELFYDDSDRFTALAIGDPDNDGKKEYVTGSSTSIYVIDPVTAAVEWSLPPHPYFDAYHLQIMVENIDNDPAEEIIAMDDSIKIIDGITHDIVTLGEKMGSFDLYDTDGDGIKEIVFGTMDGKIGIINSPQNIISWLPIDMPKRIGGLRVYDLTGDNDPELIFASSGRIWFSTINGHMEYTSKISRDEYYDHWHIHENIEISDFDHNGEKELFVGGSFQVTELGTHCYECVTFIASTDNIRPSCDPANDGRISVSATGGIQPYTYLWSNGSTGTEITGLLPGTYSVQSTDHVGCIEKNEVTLLAPVFDAVIDDSFITGCTDNKAAVLSPQILKGESPFSYLWNTGQTSTSLHTKEAGDYSVKITDANNCSETLNTTVVKDTFAINAYVEQTTCNNNPASIYIESKDNRPLSYVWSNGETGNHVQFSEPGEYSVTITDVLACTQWHSYTIFPYLPINTKFEVTPDNPYTLAGDGAISVNVEGGFPPYEIEWYDQVGWHLDSTVSLSAGKYEMVLRDSLSCFLRISVSIPTGDLNNFCKVYPVPVINQLTVDFGENYNPEFSADLVLWNMRGKEIISMPVTERKTILELYSLPEAMYMLRVRLNGNEQVFKIEKLH